MHQTMLDYLGAMEADDRTGSVPSYALGLRPYWNWLQTEELDPLRIALEDLQRYQRWLAEEYRQANGKRLKKSTQHTRLTSVVSYYDYLTRRGLLLVNPATRLKLPSTPTRNSPKDYLDLQEATALIQTQAEYVLRFEAGSLKRAEEERNLAMVCLAIATGRRRSTLLNLKVDELDTQRLELRVEREKGRPGRVLPVAGWAVSVCKLFTKTRGLGSFKVGVTRSTSSPAAWGPRWRPVRSTASCEGCMRVRQNRTTIWKASR